MIPVEPGVNLAGRNGSCQEGKCDCSLFYIAVTHTPRSPKTKSAVRFLTALDEVSYERIGLLVVTRSVAAVSRRIHMRVAVRVVRRRRLVAIADTVVRTLHWAAGKSGRERWLIK
jgi:hypothetical protein